MSSSKYCKNSSIVRTSHHSRMRCMSKKTNKYFYQKSNKILILIMKMKTLTIINKIKACFIEVIVKINCELMLSSKKLIRSKSLEFFLKTLLLKNTWFFKLRIYLLTRHHVKRVLELTIFLKHLLRISKNIKSLITD